MWKGKLILTTTSKVPHPSTPSVEAVPSRKGHDDIWPPFWKQTQIQVWLTREESCCTFPWAFVQEHHTFSHTAADEVAIRTVNQYLLTLSPFLHLQFDFPAECKILG